MWIPQRRNLKIKKIKKVYIKKNLIIITPYFAPAWSYGGPPKVLQTVAKELIKRDFNVTVITSDALDQKRNTIEEEKMDGIQVYRYKNISNYLTYHNKFFFIPDFLNRIKQLLKKADYILFSDLRPMMHWQVYKFINEKKIPYGIFSFGQIPYDSGHKYIIKWVFDKLWVRKFVKNASWRFYQTIHERNMYEKYFGIKKESLQFLPLPVAKGNPTTLAVDIYRKYGFRSSDKVVLIVGRLNYLKGIDLLIESMISLIRKDVNIKLYIVGRDDGEEKRLRKLIPLDLRNNIIFAGAIYGDKLQDIHSLASCFALTPRFYEETSLAALEALSNGLPVVITHQAEIPFLSEYDAGYVVNNNIKDIRGSIKKILESSKKKKENMRKNSILLVQKHFSPKSVTKLLVGYIKSK